MSEANEKSLPYAGVSEHAPPDDAQVGPEGVTYKDA